MSSQRITIGKMALLDMPVGALNTQGYDDMAQFLEARESPLQLAYNGKIIVFVVEETYASDLGILVPKNSGETDFLLELERLGIFVVEGSMRTFIDNWYDGSDPGFLEVTMAQAGYDDGEEVA